MNEMMYEPTAPVELANLVPAIKLIVILRDPIQRLWQIFKDFKPHSIVAGDFEEFLSLQLQEARKAFPALLLEDEDEEIATQKTTTDTVLWPEIWTTAFEGKPTRKASAQRLHILESCYWLQLDHWLRYFPLDQFFIVTAEELRLHPVNVLNRLTTFLDLEPSDWKRVVTSGLVNASAIEAIPGRPPGSFLTRQVTTLLQGQNVSYWA